MPRPVSRREFIRRLRSLGWVGPFPGGKHPAMRHPVTGSKIPIPGSHRGDIDWSLTKRVLEEAGIRRDEWEQASR